MKKNKKQPVEIVMILKGTTKKRLTDRDVEEIYCIFDEALVRVETNTEHLTFDTFEVSINGIQVE